MGTEAAVIERPEIKERPIQPEASFSLIDAISGQFLGSKNSDTRFRAEALYWRQAQERAAIDSKYASSCSDIRSETCSRLGKAPETTECAAEKVARFKKELYTKLGIPENKESANDFGKFKIGLADGIVGDNIDLAEWLLKVWVDKVAEALLAVFSSIDKVKEFLQNAGKEILDKMIEQFGDLLSMDAYKTGKAIGWLGLGVIGSVWRHAAREATGEAVRLARREAKEKGVMDVLEWKGRFMLPMDTHPNIMGKKLFEFGDALNADYLVWHKDRINATLMITNHLTEYVIRNEARIRSLKPSELKEFQNNFSVLWKNYSELAKNTTDFTAPQSKFIRKLKDEKMTEAFYVLTPKWRPVPEAK